MRSVPPAAEADAVNVNEARATCKRTATSVINGVFRFVHLCD